MKKAILATGNQHKVDEISKILNDFDIKVITMHEAGFNDEIIEDGETFEQNSFIKAKAVMDKLNVDVTIADDSGLEVHALNNAPGVYSARYAGDNCNYHDNNKKLLKELGDLPLEKRSATFVTVITYLMSSGEKIVVRGEVEGYIAFELKGDNGFGYDPLFIVKGDGRTYAEMQDYEKNNLSHRALALKKLKEELRKRY